MLESYSDRATFFSTSEFAVTAQIVAASSGSESLVKGIFDSAFMSLDLGAGTVSSIELQFTVQTDDVAAFTQGDALILDGKTYEIIDLQADGTGITVLKLHRA